ncbi:universal stress protein [Saccharopolyspora gloriosae]|uniref:Nucleotide-binding universal stress UspA family protein n=1 Tax=Saccharopolyspora gloriosae TaxID=455344 RepID=A0A840NL38_9PSEU|nr:universal stress protein [Saccharopolyspora gloriosae]MBB5069999.1 nucleotide-binding universal stress UspA family protein [Saccharopolyspora gloriosae]
MGARNLVIAAVDRSDSARQAAFWAAEDAALRGAGLQLVGVAEAGADDAHERATLDHVAQRCRQLHPEALPDVLVAHGNPITELVRLSAEAELVVLGAHGRTASRWASVGSVATRVATHASCPAVVVREPRSASPVVVGVDGSQRGRRALEFAFTEARARNSELVAVRARDLATVERFPVVPPLDFEIQAELDRARRELDEALSGVVGRYPEVTVRNEVRCGHPTAVLLHLASRARLLVVAHRGAGGFAGLLLGSTAAGVLRDAPCPVAILRG